METTRQVDEVWLLGLKEKFLNTVVGHKYIDGVKFTTRLRDVHTNTECIRLLMAAAMIEPHAKLERRFRKAYGNVHGDGGNRDCKPRLKFKGYVW